MYNRNHQNVEDGHFSGFVLLCSMRVVFIDCSFLISFLKCVGVWEVYIIRGLHSKSAPGAV